MRHSECPHGYDRRNVFCPTCDNRRRVAELEAKLATCDEALKVAEMALRLIVEKPKSHEVLRVATQSLAKIEELTKGIK